jgi:hypothetical protein
VKTWLDVPFAEKDTAKMLGARFDMAQKRWYVPDGVDTQPFFKWVPGLKLTGRGNRRLRKALKRPT